LRKALSDNNIRKGFNATGIFPLKRHAIDSQMMPSESYRQFESGGGRKHVLESGHVGGEGRHGEDVVGPSSPSGDGAPEDEIEELWQGGEMRQGSPH
jgi:hypothetical protein